MVLGQVYDDRDKHRERLVLVRLQDVEEVIILKEAHSSVSNLQMNTTDTLDNSLEQLWNQVLNLVDFAYFEYFLKLCQE